MKLLIAGKDRSEDLGRLVRQRTEALSSLPQHQRPTVIPDNISAHWLTRATDEDMFQDEFLRLIRQRDGLDALPYYIPRRPGRIGEVMARMRAILWRVLRYQWERIAFRQNGINSFYTQALEYERELRKRDVARLERRLSVLEEKKKSEPAS